jgi:hypothetical protein
VPLVLRLGSRLGSVIVQLYALATLQQTIVGQESGLAPELSLTRW